MQLLMVVYHMGTGDGNLTTTDGFSFFTNGALVSLLVRLFMLRVEDVWRCSEAQR